MTKRKKKFEPNVWIKFELEGITIVGRTLETTDNQRFVAIVDALGNVGHLPWEHVQYANKLSKLTFLPTKRELDILNGQKPVIVNDESQKLVELSLRSFIGKKLPEA